jgi:hypothetical protein
VDPPAAPTLPTASSPPASLDRGRQILDALPASGLFADLNWRIAAAPFPLPLETVREIEGLGRVLLQFCRAANLLYRRSVEGKAPPWVAQWLDQGKPSRLIDLQRDPAFKSDTPRVLRPDLILTDGGLAITELDSVPGGIGLTAWLYQAYEAVFGPHPSMATPASGAGRADAALSATPRGSRDRGTNPRGEGSFFGSARGMIEGFAGIFGDAPGVHVIVSEESATYRPEMTWLSQQPALEKVQVREPDFTAWREGDAIYRFFELFDLDNVPAAWPLLDSARRKQVRLTPPPKPILEEKLLFGLLWNRHLREYWRQELGEAFFKRLLHLVPYTWVVDPAPLPPHAALPELGLTDWHQLKAMSQRERELILKVSGYSEEAWGARGVYLGSDLNLADWSAAVDRALAAWPRSPYILQRYHKPAIHDSSWFDFERNAVTPMRGRVRLCPFYFVHGDGDSARPHMGGVLATVCPADKKIIHGMRDAVLAPCSVGPLTT